MRTIVYKYGLLPPTMGADIVWEQMLLGHKYHNQLIAFARLRRDAEREAEPEELRVLVERSKKADENCRELAVHIKALRQRVGKAKGKGATDQERRNRAEGKVAQDRLRKLRVYAKEVREELYAARKAAKPILDPIREVIHERWLDLRRAWRAEYSQKGQGLRHGTYSAIEEAVDQACGPLWDGTEPSDPCFRRWDGTGGIGVQIQGGCPVGLLGTHQALQLDRIPDLSVRCGGARDPSAKPPKRSKLWGRLRLRVGTEPKTRGPVWAEWPCTIHRPLPEDSTIMKASVHVHRTGPRQHWTCELTIRLPEGYRHEPCGHGTVGVRLGWKVLDWREVPVKRRDGTIVLKRSPTIRCAEWAGEDGGRGELDIPARLVARIQHARGIRAIRSGNQDDMSDKLIAWLNDLPTWPAWMQTKASLVAWESPRRWASLLTKWSDNRWSGDDAGYDLLSEWVAQDRHLWEWEVSEDQRARRWRKDIYRTFAAMLARRYEKIALPDINWSELARRGLLQDPGRHIEAPDDGQDSPQPVRERRVTSAVGELEDCILHAASSRGGGAIWVDAAGLGYDADGVEGGGRGVLVLKRGLERRERPSDEQTKGAARKKKNKKKYGEVGETRWARVKRLRKEKVDRGIGSRKEDPKEG